MTAMPPLDADRRVAVAARDDRVRFVLEYAQALQRYGAAAHRLEAALESCCRHLGLQGQFFATPTSVFCAFGDVADQRVHLLRVNGGGVNLGKLTALYGVYEQLLARRLLPIDAAARVRGICATTDALALWARLLSHGVAAASAACFFGGGWSELALAGGLGVWVGVLLALRSAGQRLERVVEPVAAFTCALAVGLCSRHVPLSRDLTVVASVIVLLPGFALTIAMAELAYGHLAAGTARLMGAVITFLTLGVGVALGLRVSLPGSGVLPPPPPVAVVAPWWVLPIALPAAALAFVVLFRARRADALWIVATCALAFSGARWGSDALGPELGVFVGALLVGVVSNLLASARATPSAVTIVPGLMVLVPGSLGLRSLASLVEGQTLTGVHTAFAVLLVAGALVTGLLVANVLVRSPREL
jgi:uncharacterized membrane protein YjjP (DUF1212 family)